MRGKTVRGDDKLSSAILTAVHPFAGFRCSGDRKSAPYCLFYRDVFEFTDTPQIEEVMYWNDESIDQFLDEQGDIVGMNVECDEFDTNMTV